VRTGSGEVRAVTAADYSSAGFVTGTIPAVIAGRDVVYSREVFTLDPALSFTGGSLLLTGSREREYFGAAVTLARRLSDGWMIRGYLNYGEAEWKVDDEYLRNNDPNRLTGGGDVDGDLFVTRSAGAGRGERFYQSSWSANLNGMVQIASDRPWGFNLSGNVQARQGHPMPFFAQLPGAGGELYTVGAVDDLGELRLGDVVTVDLRVEKELGLSAGGMGLVFGIDAFNVTNEGTALSRERNLSVGRAFFVNDTMGPRVFRMSVRLVWK
jgi:hypothetical protein